MKAPRIGNAQSALNRIRQVELDSRRQASTILQPGEVAGGLSPARMLTTTLGGAGVRAITPADLAQFKKAVAALGDKAQQGLTAKEALGLSRTIDIERAKTEIRYSMPARLQAGKVHLVTDSGPRSKVTRHHVNIEFSAYSAALARPGTPADSAKWLCKESTLRFECDCQHFRYFLRFVATAGGWVTGRSEHGMPKLTNPTLDGACCKHLARVMTDVQSSVGFRQHVAKMIEADRARIDRPGRAKPRAFIVRQSDAEAMLPKNARRIVVPATARGASLPKPASASDIRRAVAAYAGRSDPNSVAIARALQALLAAQQGGARA
ncbi:hypothetical protein [Variovorax saccharolyticus]|uniref:hypothetical protein n=1 Tax=Variovorax saccharolyticus TaxID=3053516 RepID=UPI002578DB73|nr:hypothetical protein [Variovorax sp. J22R187]MDM0018376.1 hypothetical protein [Variovorax sp. J22R187]